MSAAPAYHSLDIANLANVPEVLLDGRQHVAWREIVRKGKPTKPPVNPHTGGDAESDNPETWATLNEALAYYANQRDAIPALRGVGRVLDQSRDGIIGIDFDNCLDENANLIPGHPATKWLPLLNSYSEISPSGRGVKVFVRASHPLGGSKGRNNGKVEVWSAGKYFTITGLQLTQYCGKVEHRQAVVDAMYAEQFPENAAPASSAPFVPTINNLSDAEIIEQARKAKSGARFRALWEGDISAYPSQSEADAALCAILWFRTGDKERVRHLFGQGALGQRHKWQRADYQERTLKKACHGPVYSPRGNGHGPVAPPPPSASSASQRGNATVVNPPTEPAPETPPADVSSNGAEMPQPKPDASPFKVSDDGVFHLGMDKDGNPNPPLWLCGRLEIVAKTRDGNSAAWGRLLRWKDDDGVPHEWAMPSELLQGDGLQVRSELARQGLQIAPGRAAHELLLTYLQVWPVGQRARCVERLGWHGQVYVVPSETIGEGSEHVVFQNAHALEPAFSTSGTSEEWRDNVAVMAQGNSRMVFALSVAFAGPLIEPAGEDSGGFHLRGASSTGKSTALRLAGSVYGDPSNYCRSWRATTNGLEGLAAVHNDNLLTLDELGQVDPREAGEAAYMLANGRGKARAARDGTARRSATWRLLFLSAGEESLSGLMAQIGRKPTAGQEIRLADFDADAGAGMGALESLNGCASSAALATTLRDAAGRYYGGAGAAWIRWLVRERSKLAAFIHDGVRQFVEEHAAADVTGQVERVARRFGLVAVAGELATYAGLTGWPEGEANQAAGKCFAAWLESFGGSIGNRETRELLGQVKGFFEQFGASRFESVSPADDQQRIPSRAGFYRLIAEGRREYFVLPEVFKNEVCKGFDTKTAVKVLRTHGWLIPGSDGKSTQKPRLPEIGLSRVYVLGEKMWEHEG